MKCLEGHGCLPRVLTAALVVLLLVPLRAASPARAESKPEELPTHKVRRGQNLWDIAKKYGCTLEEMETANQGIVKNRTRIYPGQKLRIPRCSGKKHRSESKPAFRERRGRCHDCRWRGRHINRRKLKREMKKLGFKPPQRFRALVVKTTLSKDRKRILKHELFDYGGKAADPTGWNPASTVKLFSGVSALERVRALGFSPEAKVTFHYKGGDRTFKVEELFEEAVHLSKNIPHNRLVQLAGFDNLNGRQGTLKRAGLEHSYVMRAYEGSAWEAEGHSRSLRSSPAMTLREGKKKKKVRARRSRRKYPCSSAACTSLSDLAKMMCTIMLHEQLPRDHRLRLGKGRRQGKHLLFLRRRLNRKRVGKKDPVWKVLERHFIPKQDRVKPRKGSYQLFRKAGYSYEWLSDNLYIYLPKGRTRWLVAMAGYPGRDSLTKAADVIARIIKGDSL